MFNNPLSYTDPTGHAPWYANQISHRIQEYIPEAFKVSIADDMSRHSRSMKKAAVAVEKNADFIPGISKASLGSKDFALGISASFDYKDISKLGNHVEVATPSQQDSNAVEKWGNNRVINIGKSEISALNNKQTGRFWALMQK